MQEPLKMAGDDAPAVLYLQQILEQAAQMLASDVHVEPYEHQLRIRVRVDGVLREIDTPPLPLKDRLASRIKVLSRLDIAEKRLPQDGRMKLNLPSGKELDLRVSTLPTLHGENWCFACWTTTMPCNPWTAWGTSPSNYRSCAKPLHSLRAWYSSPAPREQEKPSRFTPACTSSTVRASTYPQ